MGKTYTQEEFDAALEQMRVSTLEEAAKVCETEAKEWEQAYLLDEEYAVKNCAAAIRGLK